MSYKKENKGPNDDAECRHLKMLKLHLFENKKEVFDVTCELVCTAKINQY